MEYNRSMWKDTQFVYWKCRECGRSKSASYEMLLDARTRYVRKWHLCEGECYRKFSGKNVAKVATFDYNRKYQGTALIK